PSHTHTHTHTHTRVAFDFCTTRLSTKLMGSHRADSGTTSPALPPLPTHSGMNHTALNCTEEQRMALMTARFYGVAVLWKANLLKVNCLGGVTYKARVMRVRTCLFCWLYC